MRLINTSNIFCSWQSFSAKQQSTPAMITTYLMYFLLRTSDQNHEAPQPLFFDLIVAGGLAILAFGVGVGVGLGIARREAFLNLVHGSGSFSKAPSSRVKSQWSTMHLPCATTWLRSYRFKEPARRRRTADSQSNPLSIKS